MFSHLPHGGALSLFQALAAWQPKVFKVVGGKSRKRKEFHSTSYLFPLFSVRNGVLDTRVFLLAVVDWVRIQRRVTKQRNLWKLRTRCYICLICFSILLLLFYNYFINSSVCLSLQSAETNGQYLPTQTCNAAWIPSFTCFDFKLSPTPPPMLQLFYCTLIETLPLTGARWLSLPVESASKREMRALLSSCYLPSCSGARKYYWW